MLGQKAKLFIWSMKCTYKLLLQQFKVKSDIDERISCTQHAVRAQMNEQVEYRFLPRALLGTSFLLCCSVVNEKQKTAARCQY